MKLNKLLLIAIVSLTGTCTGLSGAQAANADVPDSLTGTYDMAYVFGTTPYTANSTHRLVISGAADTLCVDGKMLSNPVFGHTDEYTWVDAGANLTFYLAPKISSIGAIINVYDTAANKIIGQFAGAKSSASTDCVSMDEQSVLDLALELYPALFSNGSALGLYDGYRYKYFADSKIYVGLKNSHVYLMGGMFGSGITDYGLATAVSGSLQSLKATLHPATSVAAPLVISSASPTSLNGTLSKTAAQFESGSSNATITTYNNSDPYCRVAAYSLTNSGNGKVYVLELTYSKDNRSAGIVKFRQDGSASGAQILGPVNGISVDLASRRITFANVLLSGSDLSLVLNGTLEYPTNFVVANRAACG